MIRDNNSRRMGREGSRRMGREGTCGPCIGENPQVERYLSHKKGVKILNWS